MHAEPPIPDCNIIWIYTLPVVESRVSIFSFKPITASEGVIGKNKAVIQAGIYVAFGKWLPVDN